MTRKTLLALLLFVLPLAAQEQHDVATVLTLDKTTAYTGERITGTMTVVNKTAAVANVQADIFLNQRQQRFTNTAPQGWSCEDLGGALVVRCTGQVAGNAQAALPFVILLRNDLPEPELRLHARTVAYPDTNLEDNEVDLSVPIVPHPSVADLAISVIPQQNPVPPGTPHVVTIGVRNDGPAAAHDVLVRIQGLESATPTIAAEGWTCTTLDCTRPLLGSGETAPITITFPTAFNWIYQLWIEAGAERSFDPTGNTTEAQLGVGTPSSWKRILLPVAPAEAPGSNHSVWRTDVTGVLWRSLFLDDEITPRFCFGRQCREIPVGTPFDFKTMDLGLPGAQTPASFVYMNHGNDKALDLNLRVRDLTRTAETWGTEVPAVRESEFRTAPIVLMPLPVDPLFRTNLRIYDFDARPDATVAIHVYADEEAEPRTTIVLPLLTVPTRITTSLLPMYPGYRQLDPIAVAGDALAGARTAWVRIEPRTEGLRFWAFATVTNNPTGHVTTVTPQ